MNVGLILIPPAGSNRETRLNEPAARFLAAAGQTTAQIFCQDRIADILQDLLREMVSREAPDWLNFLHDLRNGRNYARCEVTPSPDRETLLTFQRMPDGMAALFFSDISDVSQHRIRRHRTDKLATLGRLAANYAHDFNNYLAVIDRQLELMAVQDGLTPELARLLERAQSTARSAAGRSLELLTFSKPKRAAQKWIRAREIIGRLRASTAFMQSENLLLSFAADTPLAVNCDAIFLHSALLNLVINACDACGRNGSVSISAREATGADKQGRLPPERQGERWLKFSVTDTGPGIPENIRGEIFDPFFTTKSEQGGSGLGLSIVDSFIRSSQGMTYIEDTSPNGTTISLMLPADLPEGGARRPAKLQAEDGAGLRVLMVEDEFHLAESTRILLERRGFSVTLAHSLEEAMPHVLCECAQFDVVLSDVILPDGNGLELCRRSKAVAPDRPVLLISGNIPEILADGLGDCGADQVLMKPMPISDLAEALVASVAPVASGKSG